MSQIANRPIEISPVILSLDTSSRLTSIALRRGAELLFSFGALLDDNRSSRLWNLIDFLLTETGVKLDEVDLIAVCIGPGGFTGLRVGMATAKGIAVALNRPVVGITSLEAAAAAIREQDDEACEVLVLNNAYKGEVYSQLFSFDDEGGPVASNEPSVGELEQVLTAIPYSDSLFVTGDVVMANEKEIQRIFKEWELSEANRQIQGKRKIRVGPPFFAATIAQLAYFRYKAKLTMEPEALQACYVRGADIKIKQG